MALTPGFQLPFGIQPLNPIPVDSWSGPYEGITINGALTAANVNIPYAVRFQGMEVRLTVNAVARKYWYKYGIADSDLIEFPDTLPSAATFTTSVSAPSLSGSLRADYINTRVITINSGLINSFVIDPSYNNKIIEINTNAQSVSALYGEYTATPPGAQVTLINTGTNSIILNRDPLDSPNVELISRNNYRNLAGVASVATLIKLGTNRWVACGTLTE